MTRCQALKDFPDTSKVLLHKGSKIKLVILLLVLQMLSLYIIPAQLESERGPKCKL
jgi:hypothetical protein